MKKTILILLTLLLLTTAIPVSAAEDISSSDIAMSETSSVETENSEELAELKEKQKEQTVLTLIIIGMTISLGALYTLKYVSYKKEKTK